MDLDPASQKQVPSGGGHLPVGGVALFWVVSWIGFDEVKALNQAPSAGTSQTWANIVALRVGWYVWVKLYTPAGLNLFEKSCLWLKMTW